MRDKRGLLLLALGFIFLIGGAAVLYKKLGAENSANDLVTENTAESDENTGEQEDTEYAALDFTVLDADGNEIKLTDFAGKPVVLNFWASWCGPCKSEMPEFDEAYAEYGDDICFMMVNLTDGYRETMDSARKYVEEQGYSFPVYFDTKSSAAIAYGVMSIPVTYLIDEEGNIVAQGIGALDGESLRQGLEMLAE